MTISITFPTIQNKKEFDKFFESFREYLIENQTIGKDNRDCLTGTNRKLSNTRSPISVQQYSLKLSIIRRSFIDVLYDLEFFSESLVKFSNQIIEEGELIE